MSLSIQNNKENLSIVRRFPLEIFLLMSISALTFFAAKYTSLEREFRTYIQTASEDNLKALQKNTDAFNQLKSSIDRNNELLFIFTSKK